MITQPTMITHTIRSIDPVAPTSADTEFARESARLLIPSLATANGTVRLRVEEPNAPNEVVVVPTVAFELLLKILKEMADGNTVRVISGHPDLTTGDIAELLNCSRPHVIKLLDDGLIPSHRVGTHRRAHLQDVMDYREEHYRARKAIVDEMSAIDQELGLV
jgi:excisionase family DNA binding protein